MQADDHEMDQEETTQRKSRTFRKFSYRGVDLEQLFNLSNDQVRHDRLLKA